MRTQLLVSFGVLVVLGFACFIGIWASAVLSASLSLSLSLSAGQRNGVCVVFVGTSSSVKPRAQRFESLQF